MDMRMDKGMTVMVMPDGTVMSMPMMDEKMMSANMDMMKKMSTPMMAPMMLMMGTDGKMYTAPDMKMADGMMMSDMMKKMK